jgi:fused signal recognition particle receptor
VIRKLDPTAPQDCLLVLDATTGQNAHQQVEIFLQLTDVTGLVVTKLDGTAAAASWWRWPSASSCRSMPSASAKAPTT